MPAGIVKKMATSSPKRGPMLARASIARVPRRRATPAPLRPLRGLRHIENQRPARPLEGPSLVRSGRSGSSGASPPRPACAGRRRHVAPPRRWRPRLARCSGLPGSPPRPRVTGTPHTACTSRAISRRRPRKICTATTPPPLYRPGPPRPAPRPAARRRRSPAAARRRWQRWTPTPASHRQRQLPPVPSSTAGGASEPRARRGRPRCRPPQARPPSCPSRPRSWGLARPGRQGRRRRTAA
mmetsp:Transcript_57661/g.155576  ORF Transcript_57661/g.155576 Transcript_57661/m.155576 type:complete len:240 (-) Transcript_57661:227-946(-)